LSASEVSTLANSTQIKWLISDHLGTPRIIIDQTGSPATLKRHDYLPFGEEISAGTGGRTSAMGYVAGDNVRQQFTSKERDGETGLDYFINRYYSGPQGRFVSPDEFTAGPQESGVLGSGHPEKQALKYAEVTNPQSLNKYQYCFNNPLHFVDPDGQNPQDGYELRLRRDERDLLEHRMTPEEFSARRRREGVGAVIGIAAVVTAAYGAEAATAIFLWASRNPEAATNLANEVVQASSGNPAPASRGLTAAELGLAREAEVASITGGRIVRQDITVANVGRSEIDVIGGAGEYIQVGGPGKMAPNLGEFGKHLSILRKKAEEDGVIAVAYFAEGTSEAVLKVARRRLGAENVHMFKDVK
jgi:RHS repeat-associated protein